MYYTKINKDYVNIPYKKKLTSFWFAAILLHYTVKINMSSQNLFSCSQQTSIALKKLSSKSIR